ncbi:MAG: ChbG/HpnK family deacetylase [Alsobacter sp.]
MLLRSPAARPTRFVLVADDFGMTQGVSRSILALLEAGRLTGAGVMANMPWASRLGRELAAHAGLADLGLHLNLTLGRPLGPMPALCPGGALPSFGALARLALAGGASRHAVAAELAAEIDRQVDAYAEAVGRLPDYVDGHQHVQVLPGVRSALLDAVARRPGWRPWLRDSGDRLGAILVRGVAAPKALVIAGLSLGFARSARRAGLETNEGFSGVSPFDPTRDFGADFARFLAVPGPRHLVMCHPGLGDDDELARLDPVVATRPQEHAFLSGSHFLEVLAEARMALARFGEL